MSSFYVYEDTWNTTEEWFDQTFLDAVQIVIKNSDETATIETINTGADGIAAMTDISYTGGNYYVATLTLADYQTRKVSFKWVDADTIVASRLYPSSLTGTTRVYGQLFGANEVAVASTEITFTALGDEMRKSGNYAIVSQGTTVETDGDGIFECYVPNFTAWQISCADPPFTIIVPVRDDASIDITSQLAGS